MGLNNVWVSVISFIKLNLLKIFRIRDSTKLRINIFSAIKVKFFLFTQIFGSYFFCSIIKRIVQLYIYKPQSNSRVLFLYVCINND